jgi:hypothetical protein
LFSIRNSFTALQAQINIAIRINAAIFVEIFFKGNKIFNSKYIILWLVKPNKTYNEFTAKKIEPSINYFCRRRKSNTELLDSNFELEHLYSTQNDFQAVSTSKKSLINRLEENQCASNTQYLFGSFKIPREENRCVGLIVALDSIRTQATWGQS